MSMEIVLAAASIASAVGQMGASAAASRQAQTAAAFQAQSAREAADMARLQAADEENRRNKQLETVLATNQAWAARAGLAIHSPSFAAIQQDSSTMAAEDIANIRLMGRARERQYDTQARLAEFEGESARERGQWSILSGAGTLFRGGNALAKSL